MSPSAVPQAPKCESDVRVALNELESQTNTLMSQLKELEKQLSPVLRVAEPAPEDDEKATASSPLVDELVSKRRAILECTRHVMALIERLTI